MFGNYSYLFSILVFAGIPVLLEVIFGFYLIKKFFKSIGKMIFIAMFFVPIMDVPAFWMNAWLFNPQRNLQIIIAGDVLETYIFTIFIIMAIGFAVYVWTGYEDKNLPILKTSLTDIMKGKYAVWREKEKK